jgi:DNA-binding MarR family transcriptional regulator
MDETSDQLATPAALLGNSTPADGPGESLRAVCQQIVAGRNASRQIAAMVRGYSLSEAEFRLLWQLYGCQPPRDRTAPSRPTVDGPALDQKSLQTKLALSAAQISAIVEQLVARGWLARKVHSQDRRRHLVQLTEQGHGVLEKVLAHIGTSRMQWDPILPASMTKGAERKQVA